MKRDLLTELRGSIDSGLTRSLHVGTAAIRVAELQVLPDLHRTFIAETDGLSAYDGFYRLFGTDSSSRSLARWNQGTTWKFAWSGRADDYLAFGETGFGDQYAYRLSELSSGNANVYYLDANTLEASPLGDNFEEFLQVEFLHHMAGPSDEYIVGARQRLGPLAIDQLCVFSPSPLLCGFESFDHLMKLPAATAMIFGGDIATQLAARPGVSPRSVVPYDDELGRSRLRITY